jgi:hypothetical protein
MLEAADASNRWIHATLIQTVSRTDNYPSSIAGPLATNVPKATKHWQPGLRVAGHAVATSTNLLNKIITLYFWSLRMGFQIFMKFMSLVFLPARHPLVFVSYAEQC